MATSVTNEKDKEDYSIFNLALNKNISLCFINKVEDFGNGFYTFSMKGKIEKI